MRKINKGKLQYVIKHTGEKLTPENKKLIIEELKRLEQRGLTFNPFGYGFKELITKLFPEENQRESFTKAGFLRSDPMFPSQTPIITTVSGTGISKGNYEYYPLSKILEYIHSPGHVAKLIELDY